MAGRAVLHDMSPHLRCFHKDVNQLPWNWNLAHIHYGMTVTVLTMQGWLLAKPKIVFVEFVTHFVTSVKTANINGILVSKDALLVTERSHAVLQM